jgi:hypothetical protein
MKWRGSKTSHLLLKWREFAQIARLILILIPLPDIKKYYAGRAKSSAAFALSARGVQPNCLFLHHYHPVNGTINPLTHG